MVIIDKWSLCGGRFAFLYQGRFIEVCPLFLGWSLFGGGLFLPLLKTYDLLHFC